MKVKYIRARLPEDLHQRIKTLQKSRGVSFDSIIASAIRSFLEDDSLKGLDKLTEQISGLSSRLKALKTDGEVRDELISHYIYYWFVYTPPLLESEKDRLSVEGGLRHRAFMEQLARKLGRGELTVEGVRTGTDG